jgi:ankyrin repeat protein
MGILEILARFQRRSFLIADSMLLTCNHQGELPLHIACSQPTYRDSSRLTEEVVRLFLDVAPETASIETNTGKTPLHIALENKAPASVITMLLKGTDFGEI